MDGYAGAGDFDGRWSTGLFSAAMTHSPFGPVRWDGGDGCQRLQQG